MAISITHPFVSLKGDGGNATLVKPSHWNAAHSTLMATGKLIGRLTGGAGAFEEIPFSAYMATLLAATSKEQLAGLLGVFDTGDIKFSADPTASDGWIAYNGEGTISKAAAGGTVRANADCLELWKILYVNITDASCPVSGGRTGSDATSATNDFNAGKTMGLPRFSGRAIIGAGTGATLTARAAGAYGGAETHTLSTAELASHFHAAAISDGGHTHGHNANSANQTSSTGGGAFGIPAYGGATISSATTGVRVTSANGLDTTSSTGSGTAHNNMQPHVAMWVKVKL